MPAALRLQAELGSSLRTLFVAPAATMDEVEAACTGRGWLAADTLWTNESPVHPTARYPAFVLLSPEGRILIEGSAVGQEQRIRDALVRLG